MSYLQAHSPPPIFKLALDIICRASNLVSMFLDVGNDHFCLHYNNLGKGYDDYFAHHRWSSFPLV